MDTLKKLIASGHVVNACVVLRSQTCGLGDVQIIFSAECLKFETMQLFFKKH